MQEKVNKIVNAFLNSAEGYFHLKRVLQDQVKHPRGLYGPMNDRPERWDYTDIRNITSQDYNNIVNFAINNMEKQLYNIIPDVALRAALDFSIHTFDKGRFQKKIDVPTYNILFDLCEKV